MKVLRDSRLIKTHLVIPVLMMVIGLLSCAKTSPGSDKTELIRVKEFKTNSPLPNVSLHLSQCTYYDNIFGCTQEAEFAVYQTDNNGEYRIRNSDLNKADRGIRLSRTQYWDIGAGVGDNFMEPEAWVNIHLTASGNYPDTAMIGLNVPSERGFYSSANFPAPADSVVHFRLFGNEVNTLRWSVFTKDRNCYQYCLVDTLATGLITLNPQKFATLTATLAY